MVVLCKQSDIIIKIKNHGIQCCDFSFPLNRTKTGSTSTGKTWEKK